MNKKTIAVSFSAFLSVTSLLVAQSDSKSAAQDLDKDGQVMREEMKEFSIKEFETIDKDRDGSLSPQEFSEGASFARFDLNSDGKIVEDEFVEVREFQFDILDQDGDGVWSAKEILHPKAKPLTKQQAFARYDADKDQQISEEEYTVFFTRDFKETDKNKDGLLSGQEYSDTTSFPRIDRDSDDQISEVEYIEFRMQQFKNMDLDRDGFLSMDEHK